MSITFNVIGEDGAAIAELTSDVLPRPGERIELHILKGRETIRESQAEPTRFEVLRVSFVARADTYRTPPYGSARAVIHVRATQA